MLSRRITMEATKSVKLLWSELPLGAEACIRKWHETEHHRTHVDLGHPANPWEFPLGTAPNWEAELLDVVLNEEGISFELGFWATTVAEFDKNFYLSPRAWYSTVHGQQVMFQFFGFDMLRRIDRLRIDSSVEMTISLGDDGLAYTDSFIRWVRRTGGMLYLGAPHADTDMRSICGRVLKTQTGNIISRAESSSELTFRYTFAGLKGNKLLTGMHQGKQYTLICVDWCGSPHYYIDEITNPNALPTTVNF